MNSNSDNTLKELQRINPNAKIAPGNGFSNEKLFAIIGAVFMGIVAILSIIWMIDFIQDLSYYSGSYYTFADKLPSIIWIIIYLLYTAGAVLTGVSLFVKDTPIIMMIGTGASALGNIIGMFISVYYFIQYPSLLQFLWIVSWLAFAAAWGMILLSCIYTDKNILLRIPIIIIAAVAVNFILRLIVLVTEYNANYSSDSFLSVYGRNLFLTISVAVGIIMILFYMMVKFTGGISLSATTEGTQQFASGVNTEAPQASAVPQVMVTNSEIYCTACGTKLNSGVKYCYNCGAPVQLQKTPQQPVNLQAQSQRAQYAAQVTGSETKIINKHIFVWVGTFLLGGLGVDRFLRGQIGLGVLKLVTGGGAGIWSLVDFIIGLMKAYGEPFGNVEDVVFIYGEYSK